MSEDSMETVKEDPALEQTMKSVVSSYRREKVDPFKDKRIDSDLKRLILAEESKGKEGQKRVERVNEKYRKWTAQAASIRSYSKDSLKKMHKDTLDRIEEEPERRFAVKEQFDLKSTQDK